MKVTRQTTGRLSRSCNECYGPRDESGVPSKHAPLLEVRIGRTCMVVLLCHVCAFALSMKIRHELTSPE